MTEHLEQAHLLDGRILEFPHGTDPAVIQATVKRVLGVDQEEELSPEIQDESVVDSVLGVVEPAIALTTGAASSAVGGLAGIGQALNPFAEEGAGAEVSEQIQEAGTFQPRTEAGKAGLERTTEQVLEPISDFLDRFRTGERTIENTNSETLATINEIAPDIVLGMFGLKAPTKAKTPQIKVAETGRIEPTLDQASQIKSKLLNKVDDAETAPFKIDKGGNIVSDKLATNAIKQGFGEDVIAMVKGASNQTKDGMKQMIDIVRKRKKNAKFASSIDPKIRNRPSDIGGDALVERFNHVKAVNTNSKNLLDRVAKTLKGKTADFSTPVNNFMQKLDDMGITFDGEGPVFAGSSIEGLKAPQKALKAMIGRIDDLGRNPDAFQMHQFKKFIDENVSFGKTGKGGLSGKTEVIIKGLRKDIDTSLDAKFDRYNNVNTAFSKTKTALDSLQDIVGKKIDVLGPSGNSAVGTLLRRLEGNPVSRVPIGNAINELESVAAKYGGRFGNDIPSLNRMAIEIDKVFGPQTTASFKSELAESVARGVESLSSAETLKGSGRAAIKKARGINEQNAFKAIETLLNRKQ